uniref:NADH dehydrogenase subunit 2 n=1 Tax=Propomacrus davidi TaxID=1968894 RepID=UPI0022FD418F|nr:NADH dehydrogenase subunit 2 [Propomacrus davidi]WBP61412.1 NADH dehydrogenase subunit 2 [Propomacrus davidi]
MYNKMMFTSTLMIGTLIAISSYSWMGMWMGLEINLLSLIPLMSETKNKMASEAALKYFITQALASTLLLFSFIMLSLSLPLSYAMSPYFLLILNTSLLTKMGAAPFHFWFPEVIEGLSWINVAIMLTWQKIAPMVLIMFFNMTDLYLVLAILASMIVSGCMGLNQVSLRKILAYSSINHIGWMLGAMWFSETVWTYYFIVYTLITLNILFIFKMLNIFFLNQLAISMNHDTVIKFFLLINFLSLGGLPPFLGFFPKWITIQSLIAHGFFAVATLMILATLMTLYFYIRVTFSAILLSMEETPHYSHKKISNFLVLTLSSLSLSGLVLSTAIFNYL